MVNLSEGIQMFIVFLLIFYRFKIFQTQKLGGKTKANTINWYISFTIFKTKIFKETELAMAYLPVERGIVTKKVRNTNLCLKYSKYSP